MLFKPTPKFGSAGILTLLIVAGALYYSGAGSWMWQRIQGLGTNCYSALASAGSAIANPVCRGLSQAVEAGDHLGELLQHGMESLRASFGIGGLGPMQALGETVQQRLSGFGSSSDELARRIGEGPRSLLRGSTSQQLRSAVDSFTIGTQFLRNGSASQALPWLQQGAALPSGYGLMSQLSLGDLYARGGSGLAPDPLKARLYYQQAQQSLTSLQASGSPQAQQILQSLPGSPQQVAQQLNQAVTGLTGK